VFKSLQITFVGIIALILLSGCASTTKHQQSGFIKNYDDFVTSTNYDNTKIYRAKGFGRESIAKLKEIKLVPFEIWINPEPDSHFNPQQLVGLSRYFNNSLRTKLFENGFNVVEKVNVGTLTLRGAFTGVKFTSPELSATDFIPFRIVLNAGNAAYLKMSAQKDVITNVSIELEFLQGVDQQRVFALLATKSVDATIANSGEDNITAVQALLDHWADNFVEKLVEIRTSN